MPNLKRGWEKTGYAIIVECLSISSKCSDGLTEEYLDGEMDGTTGGGMIGRTVGRTDFNKSFIDHADKAFRELTLHTFKTLSTKGI